jgi:CubicO group peptidase (beta-lactamase class C family)
MKKEMIRVIFILIVVSLLINPMLYGKKNTGKINLKGFPQFVEKMLKEWEVMGAAVAIVKDGKVVFAGGFGYRDVKNKLEVTPDTLFAIGSCTKAFTATVLGIMVDEGKLEWNQPVRTYLPSFKLQDPVASEQMTPMDLVIHRSGLPRHDLVWYSSSRTRKDLVNRLQFLEPSKSFRSTCQYNNLMFMAAGYMAGKIAGMSWEELVQKKIFDPLGMKTSNFSVKDSQKARNFSFPYSKRDEKVVEIPFRNIDAIGPAGSINASANEMARWILLNLNKGKIGDKQVISEETLEKLHSPQMATGRPISKYKEFLFSAYGIGWAITAYRGHLVVSHGGGIDGFISRVSLLPRDNTGVVVLTNTDRDGRNFCPVIVFNLLDRILRLPQVPWSKRIKERNEEAKKKAEEKKKKQDTNRKSNTKPSHNLEDYTGEFENPGYGNLTIKKDGEQLTAALNNLHFKVQHYHYDIFEFSSVILGDEKIKAHFHMDVKGNINRISIPFQRGVKDIEFTRVPEKKDK